MSENRSPYSPKPAPNVEAKATAKQIRRLLCAAHEHAIDDDWAAVIESTKTVVTLAEHCKQIEEGYRETR